MVKKKRRMLWWFKWRRIHYVCHLKKEIRDSILEKKKFGKKIMARRRKIWKNMVVFLSFCISFIGNHIALNTYCLMYIIIIFEWFFAYTLKISDCEFLHIYTLITQSSGEIAKQLIKLIFVGKQSSKNIYTNNDTFKATTMFHVVWVNGHSKLVLYFKASKASKWYAHLTLYSKFWSFFHLQQSCSFFVHIFLVRLVKIFLVWFTFYINRVIAYGISCLAGMKNFSVGKDLNSVV